MKKSPFDQAIQVALYALALFLPFSISGSQISLSVLIVLLAVHLLRQRRWPKPKDAAGWLILILCGWIFIAAPFSLFPDITWPRLAKLWIWFTYFVVLASLADRTILVRALRILVVAAGVVAIYGIAQHFFGDAVPRFLVPSVKLWQKTGGYYHAVGLFDHHLTYGNSLIIVIMLGLGLWFASTGWRWRVCLGLALFLSSLALVWSYARSAWVGLAAGLLVFGGLKGRKALLGTLAALLVIGLVGAQVSPTLKDRMRRAVTSDKNLERIYTWKTTLDMVKDNPATGIGPGAYRHLTDEYRCDYNIHWTATSHAHNSYLQLAAESGIAAGLLFAALLAVLFAFGARYHHVIRDVADKHLLAGATGAVAAFAVSSLLQHNAGDAEVCMTFQFAAAVLIWLAMNEGEMKK